jgi:uncharacterized protein
MKSFRRWVLVLLAGVLLAGGCSVFDEQQRRWIFQPSQDTWGGAMSMDGMQDVWIDLDSKVDAKPIRLHGLWLSQADPAAPLALYLHGARWNVESSAGRIRRLHDLGFSVLGIDYRGFGRSTDVLPSERSVQEDALAAWHWLAAQHPGVPRYVYGHSLGSAIAVELTVGLDATGDASQRAAGLMLEGAFTSVPAVASTFKWGWLPFGALVTQRFDAASRIGALKTPVLFVHGSRDRLIRPELGQALYEKAPQPKRFFLVEGGTHHNAGSLGLDAYRGSLHELFGLVLPDEAAPGDALPAGGTGSAVRDAALAPALR